MLTSLTEWWEGKVSLAVCPDLSEAVGGVARSSSGVERRWYRKTCNGTKERQSLSESEWLLARREAK